LINKLLHSSKLKARKLFLQAKCHCGYREWLGTSPQLRKVSSQVDQQATS
jgi:hypothetical protein